MAQQMGLPVLDIALWAPSDAGKTWLVDAIVKEWIILLSEQNRSQMPGQFTALNPERQRVSFTVQEYKGGNRRQNLVEPDPQPEGSTSEFDRRFHFGRSLVSDKEDALTRERNEFEYQIRLRDTPGESLTSGNIANLLDASIVLILLDPSKHRTLRQSVGVGAQIPPSAPTAPSTPPAPAASSPAQGAAGGQPFTPSSGPGAATGAPQQTGQPTTPPPAPQPTPPLNPPVPVAPPFIYEDYHKYIGTMLNNLKGSPIASPNGRKIVVCMSKIDMLPNEQYSRAEQEGGMFPLIQKYFGEPMVEALTTYYRPLVFAISSCGFLDDGSANHDLATRTIKLKDKWKPYNVRDLIYTLQGEFEREHFLLQSDRTHNTNSHSGLRGLVAKTIKSERTGGYIPYQAMGLIGPR